MSKDLYQDLLLPKSHADDQFIYYSCLRNNQKVAYAKDALVCFKSPSSVRDFVDQYSRFEFWKDKTRKEFGKDLVNKDLKVKGIVSFLLSAFVRHPHLGLMWAGCQLTSVIAYLIRYKTELLEMGFYKTWVLDPDPKFFSMRSTAETLGTKARKARR